jgi:tetratricopeptide (TPR) repeat protein
VARAIPARPHLCPLESKATTLEPQLIHLIQELSGRTLSPRDAAAVEWMALAGFAKLMIGRDEEAVAWLRRAIDTNRNWPLAYFWLAAALAHLGKLDGARATSQAGLATNPTFTISRYRAGVPSDNSTYLAQRERVYEGMRKAGVPEE